MLGVQYPGSVCPKCVDLKCDLLAAERKADDATKAATVAAARLNEERKSRVHDAETEEVNVYNQIEKAISLTSGYNAEAVLARKKAVLKRIKV